MSYTEATFQVVYLMNPNVIIMVNKSIRTQLGIELMIFKAGWQNLLSDFRKRKINRLTRILIQLSK